LLNKRILGTKIFDKMMRVKVVRVDLEEKKIDFELASL